MKLLGGRFGGVKLALLGVVGVAAVGYAGYRVFFARSGEAAVALIPADAQCVVTLDAHPSEMQIGAFTKLANALKREGLDNDLEQGVNDLIGKAGIAKEVRQYLTNNMASAWWMGTNGQKTHGVVLFSINNPGAVSRILSTGTQVPGAGVPAYKFGQTEMAIAAVVGDYLAISSDAETISRVEQTRTGGNSIGSLAEYRSARAALPGDANVMVFVSPSSLNQLMSSKGPKTSMWMSFGASLRDGGIQFDYRGPVDTKTFPAMADLSKMAPLDRNLLKKLPPDAYGLMAYSSLDRYFTAVKGGFAKVSGEESFSKGQAEFEKETGLSIENDILPAFRGDVALAVYPDPGSPKSVDGILLIDNANNGTPGALADKVRAFIERKSGEEAAKHNGTAVHFVESHMGQVTVWRLDDASAQQMRKSMGSKPSSGGETMPDPFFGDKTVSYAVFNGSLVVTTSDAMMTRALLVFNGDRNLAEDPAFADMSSRVGEKDQMMIMCSLSRVAERFKDTFADLTKDSAFTPDDVVALFGGPNAGLVGSCHIENDSVTGTLFLPLDVDRMAKLIHILKDKSSHPKDVPAIETDSSAPALQSR